MTMYLRSLGRGIAALGIIAPLGLSACNNDPGSGGLTVVYDFDTSVSCTMDQEMVQEIRVEVGDDVTTATAACDNAGGELMLAGVPAGSYDLLVQGIDLQGDAVLDNLGGEMTDDRVEIIGGDSKTVMVELDLAPARLQVRFQVQIDGFSIQCASEMIQIKGLRVEARDDNAGDVMLSHDFDLCDFDDYLSVPDEDRLINGRRFDLVVLQPIDGNGAPYGTDIELDLGDPVGAGKLVQIDASCDEGSGTCQAMVLGGSVGPTTDTDDPSGGPTSGNPTSGEPTGGDPTAGDTTG